jgi:hypothetical protein
MRPLIRVPEKEVTLVKELIEEKVVANFCPVDVSAICSIPIGPFIEDTWAWSQEENGIFIVRSCYKLLAAIRQGFDAVSSSGDNINRCWKVLWKLPIPPKVRSFWWRVINNFVPCRQILKRRHMDPIAFYKICGAEEESIFHAFFECTWAKLFWEDLKKVTSIKIPTLHPISWATDMIEGQLISEAKACVILCGCWSVWTERNAVSHGESQRSVIGSVRWAVDTTYDLARLGKRKTKKADQSQTVVEDAESRYPENQC